MELRAHKEHDDNFDAPLQIIPSIEVLWGRFSSDDDADWLIMTPIYPVALNHGELSSLTMVLSWIRNKKRTLMRREQINIKINIRAPRCRLSPGTSLPESSFSDFVYLQLFHIFLTDSVLSNQTARFLCYSANQLVKTKKKNKF